MDTSQRDHTEFRSEDAPTRHFRNQRAKFIYRLARKAAGDGEAYYRVEDLHYRSESKLPPHKFAVALEQLVLASKDDPLPDYDLELRKGDRGSVLFMQHRKSGLLASGAA